MFRKLLTSLLFLTLFIAGSASIVSAQGYEVESFQSTINVEKNTDLLVEEKITVYYTAQKHGIFRQIPTLHTSGGINIKTPASVVSVKDEEGNSYRYDVSRVGSDIRIKIGDPDRYVQGEKTYVVTYKIRNVLREYENIELYWNVAGSNWDALMKTVSATVISPYADITKTSCFAGRQGTTEENCMIEKSDGQAFFAPSGALGLGRDLTIVLAFDSSNKFTTPSFLLKAWWLISANWGYLAALLPFVIIYYFWHKRGRDKRYVSDNVYYKPDNVETKTVDLFARKNIPLVYHPLDGVSPSEVGTLIDDRVQLHDLVAEILELGRLGFLKIEVVGKKKGKKKEFLFINTGKKDEFNRLKSYQKLILDELFKKEYLDESKKLKEDFNEKDLPKKDFVFISSLKNNFYKKLREFKSKLYERMREEKFYEGNPEKTRIKWLVIYTFILGITGYLVFSSLFKIFNPYPLAIYAVSSALGFIFAFSMPSRTPKGYSLYMQAEGLREYLKKGKWRYEHMEKNLFVKDILPLAVSLRVVDQLTNDMEELKVKPPDYMGTRSTTVFASTFNDFYKQSASNLSSTPSSSSSSWSGGSGFSGGGSVGGGFGGGGGGSW